MLCQICKTTAVLTKLHYRIVTLSAQVGFDAIYDHVLVHMLNLSVFGVVLAIFVKVC